MAEWVRHAPPHDGPLARDIVRLDLRPTRVLDLRRREVRNALGPRADPAACLHRSTAQQLGRDLRALGIVEGLIVPSMAFLDRPDRSNLVLFIESLRGGIEAALSGPLVVGSIVLDDRRAELG